MHATGFFCGHTLYHYIDSTTFACRSLITGTTIPLVFYVENVLPVFTHSLHSISQTKKKCVKYSIISVGALTRTYITCTSTNYVDVSELE